MTRLIALSQLHLLAFQTDMAVDTMSEPAKDEETRKTLTEGLAKLRREYDARFDAVEDQPALEVSSDTPQEEIDAHIDARARKIFEDVDLVGYVTEVSALLMSTPQMAGQPLFPPGEITGIQVEGDHASASRRSRWYARQAAGTSRRPAPDETSPRTAECRRPGSTQRRLQTG